VQSGAIPIRRWGRAEDVGKAVVHCHPGCFRTAPARSSIVDGGLHIASSDPATRTRRFGFRMDLRLAGLRAVVAGGSVGIGAAIVQVLAAEVCDVAFCARGRAGIDATLRGAHGLAGAVDGAVVTSARPMRLPRSGGMDRIDIFVQNVRRSVRLDARSRSIFAPPSRRPRVIAPVAALVERGDHLHRLEGGVGPAPKLGAYGAVKRRWRNYMSACARLARDSGQYGVTRRTFVRRRYWDRVRRDAPDRFGRAVRATPMPAPGRAADIRARRRFVSSPAAAFVTGANWFVDGRLCAARAALNGGARFARGESNPRGSIPRTTVGRFACARDAF